MITDNAIDQFWYWINERHHIYLKKTAVEPWPWTKDPILQEWKFCNVFRELDAGTVWLRKNFIEMHKDDGSLLMFNIAWYRLFNLIATAEAVGWIDVFDFDRMVKTIQSLPKAFTSAHMTHGVKGEDKIITHVKTVEAIWKCHLELYTDIYFERTLVHAFNSFRNFYNIGPFLSYEIVTDLRHTRLLEKAVDINTWANVGPGALRGLNRIFGYVHRDDALAKMVWLRAETTKPNNELLQSHVPLPLELRDIEHSLCEYDKWARVYNNEGTPRCRYRQR